MSHACACGAPLPDRRATYCAACRGARVKQQDLARKNAQLARGEPLPKKPSVKARVWWLYFASALKVEALFRFGCLSDEVEAASHCIAKAAKLSPLSVKHALAERSIGPREFYALCKWLRRKPSDFYRDRMARSHKTPRSSSAKRGSASREAA